MTIAQRVAARQQMEAQRALAARLLAEMDQPFELSDRAKAAVARTEEGARIASDLDERASHYHQPKARYFADITSYEDPDEDGHVIWTGAFSETSPGILLPKQSGIHALCGKAHFQAARWFKEHQLGHPLDQATEYVVRTCNDSRCVAPTHHVVKEQQS